MATLNDTSAPGINRLAFSDADWQGRAFLISLMEEAGLSVRVDAFGNVIGRREGTDSSLPAVMTGSHGDSVPSGGNYDGVVGILSAIEVARSMQEDGFANEHPLDVVLSLCEESSRRRAATLGSRAMCGELTEADLRRLHDKQGSSLYEVLQQRGLHPEAIATAKYDRPLKAFFEVHIEQGKVLEHTNTPIGVVTGIAAPTRFRVLLHGQADHSGATPMEIRHDSSCAAAEIILLVESAAQKAAPAPAVGTVGVVKVTPNAMNVIPGELELGIDLRSISKETKDALAGKIKDGIAEICRRRELPYDIEEISNENPVEIRPEIIKFFDAICEEAAVSYRNMPSGAGHDAMHWAEYAPTGMLFIPCKDGISHNPAELAKDEDIVTVAQLLEQAVRKATKQSTVFE